MAVVKETSINRYVGDTADVKPTSMPVGSTYLDRQTGTLYVCYDGTNWAEIDKMVKLVAGTAAIGGVKDNGPHWTPVRTYTTSANATGTVDITAAPAAGQKIVLDDLLVSSDTSMAVSIVEETSSTVFAKIWLTAYTPAQISLRDGIKAAVADKKLRVTASVAGNIDITATYHSEA